MNYSLLKALSNADGIASHENEIRKILYNEVAKYSDEVFCDNIGSIIFHKKGKDKNPLKIMFCAHMDEVGFIVRSISDIGFIYLMAVGSVQNKSKEMQIVRITTFNGKKIEGLLNVTKDSEGNVKEMYIDIGCDTEAEVKSFGIEIGNMVCFASEARQLSNENVYMGKAMDDRTGCYVIAEAIKRIKDDVENDIYFVGTSSEEVGTRGAKTAANLIDPDIVFALDVANNPELVKNYTNHRLIGMGPMIVHYDKTMFPNVELLRYVKSIADEKGIPYQCDMFKGGGTDAGYAHLNRNGKLALVLGIPLRYCHGPYSLVHRYDLENLIKLVCELCYCLKRQDYNKFVNFLGGYQDD
ncbi:aminopeptidase [Clostridium sp. cel8]|jgi:putative aminopeptidase FrvX|uniref:aminopeptidase n=1 Tax=unclassified Clostridium TaxID=2614128 RepID=UPI0015F7261B|nr:aminopeptidase [Clostridium sp. cel8]MBA5851198.1 aminopeptidase [Clostridium sp. cel8]